MMSSWFTLEKTADFWFQLGTKFSGSEQINFYWSKCLVQYLVHEPKLELVSFWWKRCNRVIMVLYLQ